MIGCSWRRIRLARQALMEPTGDRTGQTGIKLGSWAERGLQCSGLQLLFRLREGKDKTTGENRSPGILALRAGWSRKQTRETVARFGTRETVGRFGTIWTLVVGCEYRGLESEVVGEPGEVVQTKPFPSPYSLAILWMALTFSWNPFLTKTI